MKSTIATAPVGHGGAPRSVGDVDSAPERWSYGGGGELRAVNGEVVERRARLSLYR